MKGFAATAMDEPSPSGTDPEAAAGPIRGLGYVAALVRGSWESFLFLAPLALIFDLVGYLPDPLRLFLVYSLQALPLCRRQGRPALLGAGLLLAVIAVNGGLALPDPARVLLLVFGHLGVWSLLGRASAPLVQGVTFYTVLHLCLMMAPLGHPVREALAAGIRAISHWVTGTTLNVGYTYANVGGLLLFLSLSVHAWDRTWVSKLRTGAFLVVALLISAFAATLFAYKMNVDPKMTWELKFRDPYTLEILAGQLAQLALLVYPAFLFAAHAVGYLFLHHDVQREAQTREAPGPFRLRRAAAWLPLAALAPLLLALPPTLARRPAPSRMVFLERGVVSFTKPDYTRFGNAAGGMFGFFPEYARLFGCAGEVVQTVPETLHPDQILVMTNIDAPTPADEMERIWAFVRAGGKLWVLGDHTWIKNGRNHLNDLLAPCHIRFNHDSAQFWPQGWFHSYRLMQGTPFGGLEDPAENRLSLLVGASLDLQPPARPFVIGRFGYGDWGVTEDTENRGYLGDFKYQPTERCGDLVLVAGEQVGAGKVLVFGDTTSFFNANLSRSFEILQSSLSWLGEPRPYAFFLGRPAGIALGLALLALLALSLWTRPAASPLALALLAAVAALGLRPSLLPVDAEEGRARMALLDFSHQPYAARHGSLGDGMYGLSINLLRYGLLPISQNHWDAKRLEDAHLVVLNAPRRPLSRKRVQELFAFMDRGGVVLLACGAPHSPNSRTLLDPLQLGIRNLPLGRFFDRPAFNQPIQYFSAWPIEVRNPNAKVLSLYGDWPLMVDLPVGRGRLVLIADSEFLHNKNLESHEQYSAQNTQFVRNLLDYLSQTATPAAEAAP